MVVVLYDTEQQAQQRLDAISIQWRNDYPDDNLFEKYSPIIPYQNKFAIILSHDKYFTQTEIENAIEYVPYSDEEIIIEVP
jgi:hypothetical protein